MYVSQKIDKKNVPRVEMGRYPVIGLCEGWLRSSVDGFAVGIVIAMEPCIAG